MKKERTNLDEQQKQCKTQRKQILGDLNCFVPLIFTCMFAFVKIYQFQLKFIDHWILRLPLEIVTCTFSFFPTTFLLTAVNVNSHLSLLFLP